MYTIKFEHKLRRIYLSIARWDWDVYNKGQNAPSTWVQSPRYIPVASKQACFSCLCLIIVWRVCKKKTSAAAIACLLCFLVQVLPTSLCFWFARVMYIHSKLCMPAPGLISNYSRTLPPTSTQFDLPYPGVQPHLDIRPPPFALLSQNRRRSHGRYRRRWPLPSCPSLVHLHTLLAISGCMLLLGSSVHVGYIVSTLPVSKQGTAYNQHRLLQSGSTACFFLPCQWGFLSLLLVRRISVHACQIRWYIDLPTVLNQKKNLIDMSNYWATLDRISSHPSNWVWLWFVDLLAMVLALRQSVNQWTN